MLSTTETPLKSFRAVLRYEILPPAEITVLARSDFDALTQAQQLMGTAHSFMLYEENRLVANYQPAPGLAVLLGTAPGSVSRYKK